MDQWSIAKTLSFPMLFSWTADLIPTLFTKKQNLPLKPLDRPTRYLLYLLFLFIDISLLSTFPTFLPENIIVLTDSHLRQTPTDFIFTRLNRIRNKKPGDDFLRRRLSTTRGRYLYAHYGPKVLIGCTYCTIEAPDSFLYYALPEIVLPHLFHILVLGIVTSSGFSIFTTSNSNPTAPRKPNNPAGKSFRALAIIAGISLALCEICCLGYWIDYSRINITKEVIFWTHWNFILYRGISIAIVDSLLGCAIYLTGTNRLNPNASLDSIEDPYDKVEEIGKILEKSISKVNSSFYLKQTILIDGELRNRMSQFWEHDELIGEGIRELQEIRVARSEREKKSDWQKIVSEAEKRAKWIIDGLFVKRRPVEEILEEYERRDNGKNY